MTATLDLTRHMRGVIRWGDLPVPYIAAWSSESDVIIRHDKHVNGAAVFRTGARGQGRPIFGKMDESRQREVVIRRLCQVCRASVAREGYALDRPLGQSGHFPVLQEPLACRKCAAYTLTACPGVRRNLTAVNMIVARVTAYDVIATLVRPSSSAEADASLNRALAHWTGGKVTGPCRPALVAWEPIDPASLTEGAR